MANNLNGFAVAVISFVVLAIIIGIGGTILAEVQQNQESVCYNDSGIAEFTYNALSDRCEGSNTSGFDGNFSTHNATKAFNATAGGEEGIETFGDWLPTIAVIIAAALVIGIITSYFYMRG